MESGQFLNCRPNQSVESRRCRRCVLGYRLAISRCDEATRPLISIIKFKLNHATGHGFDWTGTRRNPVPGALNFGIFGSAC